MRSITVKTLLPGFTVTVSVILSSSFVMEHDSHPFLRTNPIGEIVYSNVIHSDLS